MALGPGDRLPDLELCDAGGEPVSLAEFRGEHALVIFLRHLA